MKKHILYFFFCCISFTNAQNLLNYGYNYGTLPNNINDNDIIDAYTSWKNTFTEVCNDNSIRVKFDTPNETVSEGIGYGMLIAAYIGDQELLDGLWNYYKSFLNNNGVMHWKIAVCSSVLGFNGATDAELDAAMALIIAEKRWGNNGTINYQLDVSNLINTIKTHEVEPNTSVLKPGDAWGGSNVTNISYFAPAYYRAYNTHTNDTSWNDVASKSYTIIKANQTATGAVYNLVSDWCTADGNFSSEVSWAVHEGKKYSYDASRTPWRIALDYLWHGNTEALAYSNSCIDFINAKNGLDNIYPGYNLDGTPFETSYKDVTFTGAYATAAMASNNQEFVNNAYSKVVEMTTDAYFGATLRVLYLLTLSGNFYSPDTFATLQTDNVTTITNKAYPNPINETLNLSFEKTTNNQVFIYDANGKEVLNKVYNNKSSSIDFSNFPKGLYLIKINNKPHKFIKN